MEERDNEVIANNIIDDNNNNNDKHNNYYVTSVCVETNNVENDSVELSRDGVCISHCLPCNIDEDNNSQSNNFKFSYLIKENDISSNTTNIIIDYKTDMKDNLDNHNNDEDDDDQDVISTDIQNENNTDDADDEFNNTEQVIQFLDYTNYQAECRLAARRQARTEAREIRMRELERQQKEAEENVDKMFDIHNAEVMNKSTKVCMPNSNRNASSVSSPASGNSYQSSRRSSEDSLEDNFNYRDAKQELKELEEKFRKAMIQNAQLDNEKSAATYQVEAYKDKFEDMEVTFNALQQEHKDKCREYDQLKRLMKKQQEDLEFYKANLEERDRLIEEEGLVIVEVPDDEKECKYTNGLANDEENNNSDASDSRNDTTIIKTKRILVSSESADMLQIGEGSIDTRLKRFAKERADLQDEISKLKIQIEEEKRKLRSGHCFNSVNGTDYEDGDESQIFATEETCRLVGDYKFKWQKAEQDISTLQANVARLESQVIRYKSAAESSEKVEDELKVEKRKLQRELREAQSRVEELETANTHLQRRLDKLKNAKSTLLKEL